MTATNYAERISAVFNAGSNAVTYPQFDLADQLKTVAKMISGGSKTKIFLLRIDGFDNHANQIDSQNNSHLGKHADLLTELSESIKAFQDDLEQLGIDENVVTTTFTEFGRKPIENGNKGTDHGNLVGHRGELGEGGAEGHSRELGLDFARDTPDLAGGRHLGVEKLDVGWTAMEEEEDNGLSTQDFLIARAGSRCLAREQSGQAQAGQAEGAHSQKVPPR